METSAIDTELDEVVRFHQAHNEQFFNGHPELEHWVPDESVTLHGGFGFTAKGWDEVRPGLIKAAARLSEGQMKFIPIGGQVAGDVAYIVGFEEGTVRLDGGDRRPMKLKVTMVFRRVDGAWRCVHRHGEMLRS